MNFVKTIVISEDKTMSSTVHFFNKYLVIDWRKVRQKITLSEPLVYTDCFYHTIINNKIY